MCSTLGALIPSDTTLKRGYIYLFAKAALFSSVNYKRPVLVLLKRIKNSHHESMNSSGMLLDNMKGSISEFRTGALHSEWGPLVQVRTRLMSKKLSSQPQVLYKRIKTPLVRSVQTRHDYTKLFLLPLVEWAPCHL